MIHPNAHAGRPRALRLFSRTGAALLASALVAFALAWPLNGDHGPFGPAAPGLQPPQHDKTSKAAYAPDTVLVAFHPFVSLVDRLSAFESVGVVVDVTAVSPYFYRTHILPEARAMGATVESVSQALASMRGVRFAEPDFVKTIAQPLPNDPRFGELYGLHNTGQAGGTPDADIDAPEAWTMTVGSHDVIVAVIDTGVDYNHPDLAANILRDHAGRVIGHDFANNDADPMDDNRHGTHCAGTIGAVGNNGIGVVGVAHRVRIMPVKFLTAGGSGLVSDAVLSIDFARANGAHIMNNSWGAGARSQALLDSIVRARDAGILFVAAAGNNSRNADTSPFYPASHNRDSANVISVAATSRHDALAFFSNFGLTVDIAAPGVEILSTVPTAITPAGYSLMDGTSMASPHVAGAAALIRAANPGLGFAGLAARLRAGADRLPGLTGRVATGRLNASNALEDDTTPPAPPAGLAMLRRSNTTLLMTLTTTGDDGSVGAATSYEVRVSAAPITEANFAAARLIPASIPAAPAGTAVRFSVTGLFPGDTIHVAVRAYDNLGNASGIATAGPFTTLPAVWADRVEGAARFTRRPGSAWAVTSAHSVSPTRSWTDSPVGNYLNNSDTWIVANDPVAVAGLMAVQFFLRMDLETNFDFLHVEASADGGATFARLASFTGVSDWRLVSVPLTGFDGRTVRLRFRMTTDVSVVRDGVYIDDFHLVRLAEVMRDNVEGAPRFSGHSPWAITTERALSPTRAWSDSPFGNYANNLTIDLTGTADIAVGEIANPQVSFAASMALEEDFDFLRVMVSRNGGPFSEVGAFTGMAEPWRAYSAPLGHADLVRLRFRMTTDISVVYDGVYLDDIAIVGERYEALATVSGVIGLDGYVGPLAARPVVIELRGPGGTTQTVALATTANPGEGAFSLSVAPGTYDLFVRGGTWLQRRVSGVTVPQAGLPGLTLSLVNGNVVATDNVVDLADFLALAAAYDTSPPSDPNADLDGDGAVGIGDFLILAANYDVAGDE
jgi:subtilisin family serine protease